MRQTSVTCIGCPLGCRVMVEFDPEGKIAGVSGHSCPRGEAYARKEVTAPSRTVTTIVKLRHGDIPVVSVKTASDIPKEKIFACMDALRQVTVDAPVKIGDIVVENICGTGVPVIATKDVEAV